MKVVKALPQHFDYIYEQWKRLFADDDFGSIDFYFEQVYNPENSWVLLDEQEELVSCCQLHPHQMVLHDKIIETTLIVGLFTVSHRQNQGHMKYLLNEIITRQENVEMLTLIQTYDSTMYRSFGFEPVYEQLVYSIDRSMIEVMDSMGVRLNVANKDLLQLYQFYTQYFNGYFVREEEYYVSMKQSLRAEDGRYIGVYDNDTNLRASIRMIARGNKAVIDELVYKDTISILKLLSFVLSQYPKVEVVTTLVEDLQKIIPMATLRRRVSTHVRLNQPHVFERLYKVKVRTADSAMKAFRKPLFNSDYY